MCWKSKLSLKPFVGALQYFLIHRCGLGFCFRDPTVFWKSVHCSGRPYLYDGVIEISVRQPEGARIIKSTGRIVLGGSRWKVWRSCRKSHMVTRCILDEVTIFLKGGSLEDVDGCWKEHHQRVHHGQDMGTVGRSRILMVRWGRAAWNETCFRKRLIRIAISSRRTNRQRKAPQRELHFRRYSVSSRELGDTDVFVPKRALKQRLGKGQR